MKRDLGGMAVRRWNPSSLYIQRVHPAQLRPRYLSLFHVLPHSCCWICSFIYFCFSRLQTLHLFLICHRLIFFVLLIQWWLFTGALLPSWVFIGADVKHAFLVYHICLVWFVFYFISFLPFSLLNFAESPHRWSKSEWSLVFTWMIRSKIHKISSFDNFIYIVFLILTSVRIGISLLGIDSFAYIWRKFYSSFCHLKSTLSTHPSPDS